MNDSTALVPAERIDISILLIRGHKVILDADLALLYGVETRALVQAVKRNIERFPEDFMFRLTVKETQRSRSQSVILKQGKNIKHLPYAFTEQGVASAHDQSIEDIFEAIRQLMAEPESKKRRIGFGAKD
jgi:hypothetical protein